METKTKENNYTYGDGQLISMSLDEIAMQLREPMTAMTMPTRQLLAGYLDNLAKQVAELDDIIAANTHIEDSKLMTKISKFIETNEDELHELYQSHVDEYLSYPIEPKSFIEIVEDIYHTQNREAEMYIGLTWED